MSKCKRCGDRCQGETKCSCRCHEYSVDKFVPMSMMPARPGDRAVYRCDPVSFVSQIDMWAICVVITEWYHPSDRGGRVVRREKCRRIVGMDVGDLGVTCVEEAGNFVGYADPNLTDDGIEETYNLKLKVDALPTPPPEAH